MRERNTETSPRWALSPRVLPLPLAHALLKAGYCALPLLFFGIGLTVGVAGTVRAQDPTAESAEAAESSTPRMLALISASAPLRLTLESDLGQERLGPISGNVLLGYALPSQGGRLQHGFGIGVSWNASHDGGYTTPVYALDQIALMPAYLAYLPLNPDVFAVGHLGVPVLVRGGPSAGLEVGAMIAYRVFAGTGVFAGLDLNAHIAHSLSVFASLELGVVIDYEVLP